MYSRLSNNIDCHRLPMLVETTNKTDIIFMVLWENHELIQTTLGWPFLCNHYDKYILTNHDGKLLGGHLSYVKERY